MRVFEDGRGVAWIASVAEREGDDYKGRFVLEFSRKDEPRNDAAPLLDVRWNSSRTAERTLKTMSRVELLRRLRAAIGRQG